MLHFLHIPGLAKLYKFMNYKRFSFVDRIIYDCISQRRTKHAHLLGSASATSRSPATSPKAGGQPAKMTRSNSNTATSSEDDTEMQMRPRDLLDMMLFNGTWTDLELRDEAFIFFVAGHETTAVTLAWILAHISADQVLQQRLREEMFSVLGHGALQKGTENQLPLLTNTIKEGLRLYPPAFAFTRYVEEDVVIDGAKIPAGYDVMLNVIGMQRNPAYFERPNEFDPDRWSTNPNPANYYPFSFGPRECIGKNFAWLEQKAIVCKILRTYELHLQGEIPDWTTLPISTTPNAPVRVQLRRLS